MSQKIIQLKQKFIKEKSNQDSQIFRQGLSFRRKISQQRIVPAMATFRDSVSPSMGTETK